MQEDCDPGDSLQRTITDQTYMFGLVYAYISIKKISVSTIADQTYTNQKKSPSDAIQFNWPLINTF